MFGLEHGRLPPLELERAYSPKELAKLTGVTPKSALRWCLHGVCPPGREERVKLPCFRAGRSYRVMGADALQWLKLIQQPARTAVAADRQRQVTAVDYVAMADALGL